MGIENNRYVRVAVIGDSGTGKTSLISTAANDTFDVRPPPVLPPVRLPPEFSPDHVAMLLTDTSSSPEDATALDLSVQSADAVVICFDALRHATLDSIRTYWYPRVQQLKPDVPVILACCKADLLEGAPEGREVQLIRERVEQAVQDLPHVEVCLNCSSRTLRMVTDVFHYALKSVLYPLQPLYDRIGKRLKLLCLRALKRIFIMCDTNQDGSLSDTELNTFQQICFNLPLTNEELQNVKQVVQAKMPKGVDEGGLTLEGFLFLQVLFIERGRLESTWAVLRKFGYNDELKLRDEILDRVNWNLPVDQVYELSDVAAEFLTHKFFSYSSDGLLTPGQYAELCGTIPQQGDSWDHQLAVHCAMEGGVPLESFLLKWHYKMAVDPRTAVTHLLYLGFGGPSGSGAQALLAKATRRRPDRKADMFTKRVIHCYVFGPRGCGKSSLVWASAGKSSDDMKHSIATRSGGHNRAASVSQMSGEDGRDRVLIMTEVPEDVVSEFVLLSQISGSATSSGSQAAAQPTAMPDLARCDVAAFLFDSSSSDSFRLARSMMESISTAAGDSLPCVMVSCKDDLGMAQALEDVVKASCAELVVPLPVPVSVETGGEAVLGALRRIVAVAVKPEGHHVPFTAARKAKKRLMRNLYTLGLSLTALAGGSLIVYSVYSLFNKPSTSSAADQSTSTATSSSKPAAGLCSSTSTGWMNTHDRSKGSGASQTITTTLSNNASETSSAGRNVVTAAAEDGFQQVAGMNSAVPGLMKAWFSSVSEPTLRFSSDFFTWFSDKKQPVS
ncbi:hypothetical protein CEUSTIGMA_g7047.t1 [Chlamydomonas eustigma]|uniref:EF hand associated type-2 domain-containing protein n=1 Tax=Chlamydomonas eustigma TaxID=1157962 RepID=A0A250X963_9CHLO|nr:hypothetical protein CEUSTIGMA_g7047.t1 [Chlamydomonas eustigma]|eukprot:GAX79606.1 hypothetical protein CEUSTIGMA_g7047.t1 [Chlamydomonas eustigma]